jgi:hypothetical protein
MAQSKLVKQLTDSLERASATKALFADKSPDMAASQHVAETANVPELFTFAGYLDEKSVRRPGSQSDWRLLYLDLQLSNWILVEKDGIVHSAVVEDDNVPGKQRDVVWVTGDTAVGVGSGSQSVEAQFLTGEFTRAADFRASPTGGTLAASTGVFCEAESIGCCNPTSRPPRWTRRH